MTRRLFTLLLPVTLAACTVENNGKAEFHPPLSYAKWETQKGKDTCTVTNGYRGLSAVVVGGKAVSFGYTRKLVPGEVLSVNVADHRYETWHTDFAATDTAAMAQDFMTADRAYLRLVRGGVQSFVDDNTLALAGFADAVKACSDKPAKKKSSKSKSSKTSKPKK